MPTFGDSDPFDGFEFVMRIVTPERRRDGSWVLQAQKHSADFERPVPIPNVGEMATPNDGHESGMYPVLQRHFTYMTNMVEVWLLLDRPCLDEIEATEL